MYAIDNLSTGYGMNDPYLPVDQQSARYGQSSIIIICIDTPSLGAVAKLFQDASTVRIYVGVWLPFSNWRFRFLRPGILRILI